MLQSFSVAFNAVFPFVIYLGVGYFAVRIKLADEAFMEKLNLRRSAYHVVSLVNDDDVKRVLEVCEINA